MKQYTGNIMAYLNDATKENIAENEHYTVEMIDAYDIIPNEHNFYGIRNVEELAAKMAISGHVTPLEVIPREDGKFTLVSGERRRAAVLLRYEAKEIKSSKVPCFIRKDFKGNDLFSAEEMETINLITANSYRVKTPFEELEEIIKLEPIARKEYDREREQNKENGEWIFKDFREFFSKKFLGMPPTNLQRILTFKKLVPEAKEVYKIVPIPRSTLLEIACKDDEVQREILKQIAEGELKGTAQEVKGFIMEQENSNPEILGESEKNGNEIISENIEGENDYNNNENETNNNNGDENNDEISEDDEVSPDDSDDEVEEEYQEDNSREIASKVKENANQKNSSDANKFVTPDEAKREADEWVQQGIRRMIEEAEQMKQNAEANGDSKGVALWELRKAAANLVLETIK